MIRTPINNGLAQSDIDFANYKPVLADLSDYAGDNLTWNATTKQFDAESSGASIGTVLGNRVSVKDPPYNATGDGVTDDSTAVQTAISDVVTAGGGTVFFPRGVYLCNAVPDPFWNSILTLPFVDGATNAVAIELLGENQPAWSAIAGFFELHNSVIKTTRTDGSGTFPAMIAAGQPLGEAVTAYNLMNALAVSIKNLVFLPGDNASYGGIRLDKVGSAFIESVNVYGGPTEPTHNVVGIWTPNTINWSYNYVNRCVVQGMKTGYCIGEHLLAVDMYAHGCYNGVKFLPNNYPCWGNIKLASCVEGLVFVGTQSVVDVLVETEHAPSGWEFVAHDIKDPTNAGTGIVRTYMGNGMAGGDQAFSMDGGAGLIVMNLFNGDITLPTTGGAGGSHGGGKLTGKVLATSFLLGYTDTGLARENAGIVKVTDGASGWGTLKADPVYVGTDARLVAISGGAKLQVRNTGTGLWADADQWTNP